MATNRDDRIWALFVGVMMWLPAELDARLAAVANLSHVEYQVLRWLSVREEKALYMGQLAASASMTPSHLSRVVARLEKRGWVDRSPDPADGRYTLARLTDAGAQVVAENEEVYQAAVQELVYDRLGPEQVAQIGDISERILAYLKPECLAAHD
ncbi:MarR family winged helix-turn-helix transcriptional regulator [Amycolatopsis jejuensis]|uniref:MarR family winged helix-turn-helix transcriptional regulator n=1 Tax=Amycolatopsis jejuensis TaxID=330084 RepID=UPI000524623F|nr:MarR family transcriptional regulator [Amycolatopsis jejuensis]